MPEIDDNTKVAIPLRNLVALGAGIVMATTAYVTLDTRITTVEHSQEIQDMNIQDMCYLTMGHHYGVHINQVLVIKWFAILSALYLSL